MMRKPMEQAMTLTSPPPLKKSKDQVCSRGQRKRLKPLLMLFFPTRTRSQVV
ncbi:hypothetical protein LINPERPRIM_LOCUS1256 [Linum perenne]